MDFKNNPLSKNPSGILGKENKDSALTFKGRPLGSTKRLPSRGDSRSTTGENFFDSNPYSLQLVNLSQDENAFASSLKIDILQLQDEINKMDIDWKIRNYTGETEFKKNYVTALKKWLARTSEISSKDLIDNKLNNPIDLDKLMETLNVKDTKDAVRKLFKILVTLEIMITKITELEVVTFLKYDDIFSNVNKNPALGGNGSKVSQLASGLQLSKFQTFLVNLERQNELFSITSRLLQAGKNSLVEPKEDISYLKTKDQILDAINESKLELGLQEGYLLSKVLKEAIDKEKKMNDDVTLLCQTVELNKRRIRELEQQAASGGTTSSGIVRPMSAMPSRNSAGDADYYVKLMDELKEKFSEQTTELEKEIASLYSRMQDTKIKNDNLQRSLTEAEERIKGVQEEKNKILRSFSKPTASTAKDDSQDTFEQALRDELTNMQKAYERKIYNIELEMNNFKKDKGKELLEFRQQLNREKENKTLLLKKLSAYIKV